MMFRPLSGFALLHALSGLGIWAGCFVVLYGMSFIALVTLAAPLLVLKPCI